MGQFFWLVNTPNKAPDFVHQLTQHRFVVAQQYMLEDQDLSRFDGIVLTMHSDQRHLAANQSLLIAFLEHGGSIVFNGHVARPFLPMLKTFRPVEQRGLESLRMHIETDHPLTRGLTTDDLTFQRSVAGFYGRGTNPPPDDATVLTSVGSGRAPVDWLAPIGQGILFVHTGNDLFSFLRRADPVELGKLRQFFDFFVRG
ncbi:MAG: hypothetical protein AAGC99_16405 [Pseudomonadota bacterium]